MSLVNQRELLDRRAALVVAHPGHELRLFGWLEISRPKVFVITDGSGREKQSRIGSTASLLKQVGATAGGVFGRLTDQQAYKAILNHDAALFVAIVQELSDSFVADNIDYVVGDARERYNPVHDLCRSIADSAAAHASRRLGKQVATFSFSVVDHGCFCEQLDENKISIAIDEQRLQRKLSAAKCYLELKEEVLEALASNPVNAFQTEFLYRVPSVNRPCECTAGEIPFYEKYGQQQVAAGHYKEAIRYAQHIAPLMNELRSFGEGS